MSLAALARQLHDAGTPIEGIILALEAVEARENEAAQKRAKAAARKQAQRDRERDCHATVTGHGADSPDPDPFLDKSPQTPKINPTPHTHGEGAHARTRRAAWGCPEGVDPAHWRDFRANRRRKKLTDTETSYAGQIRLIERFACDEWPPGRLVQHAAEKGWGTIVDPSEYETPRNGQHRNSDAPPPPANQIIAAAMRRRGEADLGFSGGNHPAIANTG